VGKLRPQSFFRALKIESSKYYFNSTDTEEKIGFNIAIKKSSRSEFGKNLQDFSF
jgi:hypothetical protein